MSYINKSTNFKLWLIFFLISWIILYLNNDATAKYMKKLSVEPFAEPKNWNSSFKPGIIFGQMIENYLANINSFEMIPFQANTLIDKSLVIGSNSINIDAEKVGATTNSVDSNNISNDGYLISDIKIDKPWFLSGGININNINEIKNYTIPYGIDISSGVEDKLGIKSNNKIISLLKFYGSK